MKTILSVLCVTFACAAGAVQFRITSDHADALYRLGEEATFRVEAYETNGVPVRGKATVRLDNFGDRVFSTRTVDLAKEPTFSVKGQMDRPGFLMLRVSSGKTRAEFGVGYDPDALKPYQPCPADFDAFWANAIARYDADVTAPIKATKVDPGRIRGRELYELRIPTVGNREVWGYLSVPTAKKGPYPLIVNVPGAGPCSFCERGDDKAIYLTVTVHYYAPKRGVKYKGPESNALQKLEDEAYAKKYPVKNVRYTQCGIAVSREDYFYYGVILAANRAINWAASRPDVDPARVKYTGGSQGGGFGLILTALNKRIRKAVILVPAITDHLCFKIDQREAGWPRLIDGQLPENRAAAEKNAPYFDGVNFASRITVPVRFSVGFIDTVCPPHAGYTAYNVCPSKDKAIRCGIAQTHSVLPEIRNELSAWLNAD